MGSPVALRVLPALRKPGTALTVLSVDRPQRPADPLALPTPVVPRPIPRELAAVAGLDAMIAGQLRHEALLQALCQACLQRARASRDPGHARGLGEAAGLIRGMLTYYEVAHAPSEAADLIERELKEVEVSHAPSEWAYPGEDRHGP